VDKVFPGDCAVGQLIQHVIDADEARLMHKRITFGSCKRVMWRVKGQFESVS